MPQRGWLARALAARRERDLRSFPAAAASCRCWRVHASSGAITGTAVRQRHGSQGRNTTRGIAPAAFPLTQRVGSLQGPDHPASCDIDVDVHQRAETAAGAKRPDRRHSERRSRGHVGPLPNRCFTVESPEPTPHRQVTRGGAVLPRRAPRQARGALSTVEGRSGAPSRLRHSGGQHQVPSEHGSG